MTGGTRHFRQFSTRQRFPRRRNGGRPFLVVGVADLIPARIEGKSRGISISTELNLVADMGIQEHCVRTSRILHSKDELSLNNLRNLTRSGPVCTEPLRRRLQQYPLWNGESACAGIAAYPEAGLQST